MKYKKIYLFIGTTAELIKIAPVIRRFKKRNIDFKLIETGQNEIHFNELSNLTGGESKPDISLGKKPKRSSILFFLGWAIKSLLLGYWKLRGEFKGKDKNSTIVIVHGDTVSSLIGAFITKVYGLKLAHVESGLRSFNFFEPFPEEISRYFISLLADIHFCPNQWAMKNLKFKKGKKINTKQNTLIESYRIAMKKTKNKRMKITDKYFVLVVHRQEHVIFGKNKTQNILKDLFELVPDNIKCFFMVYDISSEFVNKFISEKKRKNIIYQNRLTHKDFIHLLNYAEFIITDGGSNQEESYYLGLPCLLLRNTTERIEGLGSNVVVSKLDKTKIKYFTDNYKKYRQVPVRDEHHKPSEIIISSLLR